MTNPKINNETCKFYGSQYCDLLNMGECRACTFGDIKLEEEAQGIRDDLELLMNLVPEEGIAPLFAGQTCRLCVGEPRKATCYAFTDIGHAEPERVKRNFLGMKSRARVGSMIPLQIAACDRCRWNYQLLEFLPTVLGLLLPVAALIVLTVGSVQRALTAMGEGVPVLVFLAAVALGFALSVLTRALVKKTKCRETVYNVWQLPLMAKLRGIGWFSLTEDKRGTRLVFSKKRLVRGVFTGEAARGRVRE